MKSIFIYIFILSLFSLNLSSQDAGKADTQIKEIYKTSTRYAVSLSGKWRRTFDGGTWDAVELPFSEIATKPVTYERTLKIAKEIIARNTFRLFFYGVEDQVEVYVNGQFVGRYFGGMTPFDVRIPAKMIIGETNTLMFKVSPAENYSGQIKKNTIYSKKTYNGILRDVVLIGAPNIWVSDLNYKMQLSNDYTRSVLSVNANLSTASIEKSINLDSSSNSKPILKTEVSLGLKLIKKATGETVAETAPKMLTIENERTYESKFNMDINFPELWTPENPNLYELRAIVSQNGNTIDDFSINLGFRDARVSIINSLPSMLINGKVFEMKAIAYVEDFGNKGQSLDYKRMEEDIKLIKTLGANTVRFMFSPPHPYVMYLCEKYGLLAMLELPVYDAPSKIIGSDEIIVRMQNIADRLKKMYDSSPSLLAYGIYSGAQENSTETNLYTKKLLEELSSSSRLKYKIVNSGFETVKTDGFDIIGIKSKTFDSDFEVIKSEISRLQKIAEGIPVFFNYGTTIQPENRNGYADPLSVEYQAFYARNVFHLMKEREALGSVFLTFNDYRLEKPLLTTNNDDIFVSTSGLVDSERKPRLAFNTVQTLFNQEKEPLLDAGSYSRATPFVYIILGFIIILLLAFLINRFRRFREYLIRSITRPYNFYADIRDQRIMSNIQTILLGIAIALTMGIFFSSILFYYRSSDLAQYFLMLFFPFETIQASLYQLVWQPTFLMIGVTAVFLFLMFVISFVLRIFAFFLRARILFNDTLTITIWSGIPMLFLMPLAIVMVRLFEISEFFSWLLLLLSFVLIVWTVFRIFKATAVVYDKPELIVYLIGIVFLVFTIGMPLAYYQFKYSFYDYGRYIVNVLMG